VRLVRFLVALAVVLGTAGPAAAGTSWKARIDELVEGRSIGVSVRDDGAYLYRHADTRRRAPASVEKLLLAMALLDRLGADVTLSTDAAARRVNGSVVPGNLWILGHGDPAIGPARLRDLAAEVEAAGVTRIRGSVRGSTGYFARDWNAPGWRPDFPEEEIPLPTALTFSGNVIGDEHIRDPERRAAEALTRRLRGLGVEVEEGPGAGPPPHGLDVVASIESRPILGLVRRTLRPSLNFFAEVLGKRLGVDRFGIPGTIRKGALTIRSWADAHGVGLEAHDASGLSYRNRVAPAAVARLLGVAERESWGRRLRAALPTGGQGTLEDRLHGVPVRAKTGTLKEISALSGWVYLRHIDSWAEFSILSRGMSKAAATRIEDAVVRLLWRRAG